MSDERRERRRRPDPARTGPIRSWSHIFRGEEPGAPFAAGPNGDEPVDHAPSWSEAVSDGVRKGYQVIEEQIRQGRQAAGLFNDRFYDVGRLGSEFQELSMRIWRTYWELVSMWWELASSLAAGRGPVGDGDADRGRPRAATSGTDGRAAADPAGAESAGSPPVSIEVASARPVGVTLDLRSLGATRALVCHAPRAIGDGGPLDGIGFDELRPGEPVRLSVRIADGQPAGTYVGAVVDADSGEARGTLSVRVAE